MRADHPLADIIPPIAPDPAGDPLDRIRDLAYLRSQVRLARAGELHARQQVLHLQRELERTNGLRDDLVRSLFTAGASPTPPTDPDPAPPAPTFPH